MSWGPEGSGSRLVLGSRRVGVQASPGVQKGRGPEGLGSRRVGVQASPGVQKGRGPDSLGSRQSGIQTVWDAG